MLTADKIIRMKKVMKTAHEKIQAAQNERRAVAPEFIVNLDERTVALNGELWNLNPPAEEVKADLKSLIKYIDGVEDFTGDLADLKTLYWKIILYMFASPFFARLRYFYSPLVPVNSTGSI